MIGVCEIEGCESRPQAIDPDGKPWTCRGCERVLCTVHGRHVKLGEETGDGGLKLVLLHDDPLCPACCAKVTAVTRDYVWHYTKSL